MSKYLYDNFWISKSDYLMLFLRFKKITLKRHKRVVEMDLYYDSKKDIYIYTFGISLNTALEYKLIQEKIKVRYLLNEDDQLCATYNNTTNRNKLVRFKII